jgi:hypothetical protein
VRALDEEHVGIFDDDRANADQRDFGEFTLHGARILKHGVFCSRMRRHAERSRFSGGAKHMRGSSTLHARSLAPLVKARDFGMTPPLCGTL